MPEETPPPDHPSLLESVARTRSRAALPIAILFALLVAAGVWLTVAARAIRAELPALRAAVQTPRPAESDGPAAPLPSATLDTLAGHLPAAVSLAAVEARANGGLRIAIDTADPDELRRAFAEDPWLDRFRERGQEQHDDGSFRVVLESR